MWWMLGCALALLFPLLWWYSAAFRFNIKMLAFYVDTILSATYTSYKVLIAGYDPENFCKYVKTSMLYLTSKYNIKWELRGMENLKSEQPFIVCCNHQSSLDMIGMVHTFPNRCVPMAKRSLQYAGPFGLASTLVGTVFVDRFNPKTAKATMATVVDRILKEKIKVWVFPEGTRNRGGGLLPFKKGAFHIAVQAQIPIVPIVFSEYKYFYDKKENRFLSRGFVIVEALPPISTKGLTSSDVAELTDNTRNTMLSLLERLSVEAKAKYLSGDY